MEKVRLADFMGPGLCLLHHPHSSFERVVSLSTFPMSTYIGKRDSSLTVSELWLV